MHTAAIHRVCESGYGVSSGHRSRQGRPAPLVVSTRPPEAHHQQSTPTLSPDPRCAALGVGSSAQRAGVPTVLPQAQQEDTQCTSCGTAPPRSLLWRSCSSSGVISACSGPAHLQTRPLSVGQSSACSFPVQPSAPPPSAGGIQADIPPCALGPATATSPAPSHGPSCAFLRRRPEGDGDPGPGVVDLEL
jgi:hypothetical protein